MSEKRPPRQGELRAEESAGRCQVMSMDWIRQNIDGRMRYRRGPSSVTWMKRNLFRALDITRNNAVTGSLVAAVSPSR